MAWDKVIVMKHIILISLLLLTSLFGTVTIAAQLNAQNVSNPTVTRLVQIFSALELDLDEQVQKGNAEAAGKLLEADFEMRVGAMPGNPIPRAQWLNQFTKRAASSFTIQQMAVHDYDAIAVVSFLLKQDKALNSSGDIYIVDIWKKSNNAWLLAVRYASPAGSPGFSIPGFVKDMPVIDKRY